MKTKLLALILAIFTAVSLCGCAASARSGADTQSSAQEESAARSAEQTGDAAAQSAQAQYPELSADWEERLKVLEKNPVDDGFLDAVNQFALKTGAQLLREEGGCYSPLSLYYALALTAQGAEGQTAGELCALLGADKKELAKQCGNLFRRLYTDDEAGALLLANSVWMDDEVQGVPVHYQEAFLRQATEEFYASLFTADFADPATGSKIGDWIAENTRNLLRFEPEVREDQLMALINTVYFKSPWQDRFEEAGTAEDVFTDRDGQQQTVPFLHRSGRGACYMGEGYTYASLALARGRMDFYLPDPGVDVHSLLEREKLLEEPQAGMEEDRDWVIQWSVPKFSVDSTWSLVPTLEALGVKDAFTDAADFSGMTDVSARVGSIQQGTHLGIDEEGVEAAAYTMVSLETAGAMMEEPEVVEMNLNRPFLYTITSDEGAVLFLGICDQVAG